MRDQSNGEFDEGVYVSDAWWAALVPGLLHPVQMGVIEALRRIGLPLCVGDLAEIIECVEPVHLDYHVGRLRRIRALDFAGSPYAGRSFMDVHYELTPDRRPSGGR